MSKTSMARERDLGGLIGFQVGNEKGSVDLVNCQEGRGDIPNFQVGKGEEMSSAESSCQQGVLTDGEEEERPHPYEDSCRTASHVNEDDDKLKTSITEEKDQRSILVIGGVEIFLPSNEERLAQVLQMQQKDNKMRLSWRRRRRY
jgi:hypothetical protein